MKKFIENFFGVDTSILESRKKIKTDDQILKYGLDARRCELTNNFNSVIQERNDALLTNRGMLEALTEIQNEIDYIDERLKELKKAA